MQSQCERVAITGLGIVSALGLGARQTFARLLAGERGFRELSVFDVTSARCRIAAEVPPALAAELMAAAGPTVSRTDAFALAAAREALNEARWTVRPNELSLAVGGTTGGLLETEREFRVLAQGPRASARALRLLSHPLSTTVRVLEDAIAPFRAATTLCSACSSSAIALVQGAHWIAAGEASAALVGGADALCHMTFAGFNALGALDSEPCRPFDVTRAGLTLGEGAAFLLLESESGARARGARILAWLSGWAIGAEAHHVTQPEPTARRATELLRAALASAGLTREAIGYVNAHGTATRANDAMEALALQQVFAGGRSEPVRVSSSKGQLGHTLGAAGAIEAVITVLALEQGALPPTLGLQTAEASDLTHVLRHGEVLPVSAALSSSFGFGGMNAVLAFEHAAQAGRSERSLREGFVITAMSAISSTLRLGLECLACGTGEPPRPPLPFDPLLSLSPERSRRFDRAAAFASLASREVLSAAGLSADGVGLVLGNAYGNVERSVQFLDRVLLRGLSQANPGEFPHLVQSAACGNASIYLGLTGPVFSVTDGSTGAESALARAKGLLALGLCDAVLVGAVQAHDAQVAEHGLALGIWPRALARSEGGGFVVLETEASASARGARPLARLRHHVEQRGTPNFASAVWAPPAGRASVVVCSVDARWQEWLQQSSWSDVPQHELLPHTGFHEAIGAVALAYAVALVQTGSRQVLLISGDRNHSYVSRLEAAQGFP